MSAPTYLEYTFVVEPLQPGTDILIAELSELGFESFVETENGLIGYVLEADNVLPSFEDIPILNDTGHTITWESKSVAQQNWNAVWEQSFSPITVDDDCIVRAPFHEYKQVAHDIVIEPKMSFGTGHHETTYMMLKHLLTTHVKDKIVLDMGCGTGVLAILAEKLGAKSIAAIDIDNWCYTNALENAQRNGCDKIKIYQGDSGLLSGRSYDVILANINRNILLEDIPIYVNCLNKHGILLLSGFYLEDLDMISAKCASHGLQFEKKLEKNKWVAAKYVF